MRERLSSEYMLILIFRPLNLKEKKGHYFSSFWQCKFQPPLSCQNEGVLSFFFLLIGKILFLFLPASLISTKVKNKLQLYLSTQSRQRYSSKTQMCHKEARCSRKKAWKMKVSHLHMICRSWQICHSFSHWLLLHKIAQILK